MKTQNIKVKLRDGEMGAYLAIPDRDAGRRDHRHHGDLGRQRHHAPSRARIRRSRLRLPRAGSVLAAGARRRALRPQSRTTCKKAFDLYYDFDYDLARARHGGHLALPGRAAGVQRQGRRGRLLPRRQALLSDVLPHRHRLRRRLLRHLYRAQHPRGEEPASALHAAHGDEGSLGAGGGERAAGAAAVAQSAGDDPQISRRRPRLRATTAARPTASRRPIARWG